MPKLTKLDCYQNQIAHMDLSKVQNLTELDCSGNPLSELDIRQLHRLESQLAEDIKELIGEESTRIR